MWLIQFKMHISSTGLKLSKCLYVLDGFPNRVLDHALETLYKNEDEARFFIVKPLRSQIFWIEKHIHDYGLAVNSEDVEDLKNDANLSRATITLDEFCSICL
ncbi:uncharacterized protein A4U43_C07F25830 [Asparagus officinalis]|uniref:Uncharacterized protein n=1 Tax=Asparagus officinalis TaxID=4686 RepID=A0A5P1EHT9_ASPOF|nr:uncharacterized protein A4U43_C07F25830 [Asparagus officinalis]